MIRRLLLLLFAGVVLAGALFYFVVHQQAQQKLHLGAAQFLTVSKGETVAHLARRLVDNGWLDNRFWLRSFVRLHPELAKVKQGTYQLTPDTSINSMLQLLVQGKEYQFAVTFVEGSTFSEWLTVLQQHPRIDFQLQGLSATEIAQQLHIEQSLPEGWLFPDTYAFTEGTRAISILQRAHEKMQQQLAVVWQDRADNLPLTSPYQALILASIIEKETGQRDEQPLIASVFINRLNKHMRLQTDPTIIYGLGARYQGDITRQHMREKTPYNTYKINGLPPTPIAMPGLAALNASVHPADTDYLYFVSQGNGRHLFSDNFSDHKRAVARYQLKQ